MDVVVDGMRPGRAGKGNGRGGKPCRNHGKWHDRAPVHRDEHGRDRGLGGMRGGDHRALCQQ